MNPINQDVAGRLEEQARYSVTREPIDTAARTFARRPPSARRKRPWMKGFGIAGLAGAPRWTTRQELSEDAAMTSTRSRIESLVMQVQSAFLQTPMLPLTLPAVQRRFGIDEVTGAAVLGVLVDARVLTKREGVYRRNFPRPAVRPAA